jgi:hypothetical protein
MAGTPSAGGGYPPNRIPVACFRVAKTMFYVVIGSKVELCVHSRLIRRRLDEPTRFGNITGKWSFFEKKVVEQVFHHHREVFC